MSHDQNFKNLILDYPRQAIEFAAASEAARLGEEVRILPLREEQLKERSAAICSSGRGCRIWGGTTQFPFTCFACFTCTRQNRRRARL